MHTSVITLHMYCEVNVTFNQVHIYNTFMLVHMCGTFSQLYLLHMYSVVHLNTFFFVVLTIPCMLSQLTEAFGYKVCFFVCNQSLWTPLLYRPQELCSRFSSLFYPKFSQILYHYAHYYSQNLLIILIIFNFTAIF